MNKYLTNLNKIEFAVTMACTGACIHCQNGDQSGSSGHIDAQIAVKAVREVCKYYKIEKLMTFGGESLLYPDVVCAILRAGADIGIEQRQVITNGFFSKDPDRIAKVAHDLKSSGVNDLLLSVDAFHQRTVPLETVKLFAKCALSEEIPVRLCPSWLVSEEDGNPYNLRTREIIKEFSPMNIPTGSGNIVFPSKNALKYLAKYFGDSAEGSSPYDEDPEDIRTLSFSPNGDVLDGNIYKTDIITILQNYKP